VSPGPQVRSVRKDRQALRASLGPPDHSALQEPRDRSEPRDRPGLKVQLVQLARLVPRV
jgi:hypothetical protein